MLVSVLTDVSWGFKVYFCLIKKGNTMKHYLGIDIGGTNIKTAIVSEEGDILSEHKVATPSVFNNGGSLDQFIALIQDSIASDPSIKSVGIGIPGVLTFNRKEIVTLNNIPQLNGLPIVTMLEEAFPTIDFFIENDANAAALGQFHFANENKVQSLLFLTLGTGVGAALVLNGDLFLGEHGNALELHNTPYKKGKGYEFYLGKKGWARQYAKLYKKTKGDVFEQLLSPKEISQLAENGDKIAKKLIKKQGKALGELIATAIRYFDLRTVYIGGGVSSVFPEMEKTCKKTMSLYLDEYYLDTVQIKVSKLKNKAGVLGAAALCIAGKK